MSRRFSQEEIDDLVDEVEQEYQLGRYGVPGKSVRALARRYSEWHKKSVKEFQERKFTFPKELFRAGRAVSIVYESDKWEKDGDEFPYVHDFSSGPSVFRSKPKTGPSKDTRKLLHVASLNDTIPMVQLARVTEIVVENEYEKWPIAFANPPPLVTLLDMKTLIILCREPIFIVGGKMSVRAPGITK